MGAVEALKESWRLVWSQGHFWKVVGMAFLSVFVILLGALALGVGLFFAVPLVAVAGAGLYEELKGDHGTVFGAKTWPCMEACLNSGKPSQRRTRG